MERRIVVSGYYGSKNAGDEAMLAAMLEVLGDLDPKLHITVISASPADTSARHGVESVSWLSLPSIIKALWRADLLISGGGSLLQNVTSRRSLYYYLAIIFLAVIMRKKVMLYAQGIGPIIGGLAEFAMRVIGNRVDLITVRGAKLLAQADVVIYAGSLVNPELLETDGEQEGAEGCLSVPGKYGLVKRPYYAKVRAQDRNGEWFEAEGEELIARCFCHELDHLDGIVYTEVMERYLTEEELNAEAEEEN